MKQIYETMGEEKVKAEEKKKKVLGTGCWVLCDLENNE